MDVSVIICTYNRCDLLRRSLESLSGQVTPRDLTWELLIVDNNCTDSTRNVLLEYQPRFEGRMRFVREEKQGLSHARNRAIGEARGKYLLFTDDDTEPAPTWIARMWRTFMDHQCDAVAGRIELQWGCAKPPWMADELLGFLAHVDYGDQEKKLDSLDAPPIGANMAFSASAFARVGHFDVELGRKGKSLVGGEEIDFFARFLRAGLTAVYQPAAVVRHSVDQDRIRKSYFRALHFNNGKVSGLRYDVGGRALIGIPLFVFPQTLRMIANYLRSAWRDGLSRSLRQEMNVWYSVGFMAGCARRKTQPGARSE